MNVQAEKDIKKLSRLPCNQTCANCGTVQRHGFHTVCIKYLTFVCNLCKTAHQAVSHRCKSLTMSSWDTGEVLQLKKHGNDYARRVWLANAPAVGEGGRPREGDDVNVFKRFVVEAYERKRYYLEEGVGEGGGVVVPVDDGRRSVVPQEEVVERRRRKKKERLVRSVGVVEAPAPVPVAPVVDLLDFGAVEISEPAPSVPRSTNIPPAQLDLFGNTATSTDALPAQLDLFGNNVAAPPTSTNTATSTNTQTAQLDLFGNSTTVTSTSTNGPPAQLDLFGNTAAVHPTSTNTPSAQLDLFGNTTAVPSVSTTTPSAQIDLFGNTTTVPSTSTNAPSAQLDLFGNTTAVPNTSINTPSAQLDLFGNTTALTNTLTTNLPPTFDPFNNPTGGGTSRPSQPPKTVPIRPVMNPSVNIMSGGNNSANPSAMIGNMGGNAVSFGNNGTMNGGMNPQQQRMMMVQQQCNGMMNGGTMNGGMMNGGMMNGGNSGTMNGGTLMMTYGQQGSNGTMMMQQQNGGLTPQQQHQRMMMMAQQQQHGCNFGTVGPR